MATTTQPAHLLTLPTELRNAIYLYIFDSPPRATSPPTSPPHPDPLALALRFDKTPYPPNLYSNPHSTLPLRLLLTNRQIHAEASLLAFSHTRFHLAGPLADPETFALRSRLLPRAKLSAIRHLTLTARISHLRALNETWAGLPFGSEELRLESLTIVPWRPDCSSSAYAEVADLSQSHTLAYVFTETFKGLRGVGVVEVRNQGCFNDVVWRILYRGLVYRLYRWGGGECGVRFECSAEDSGGKEGERDAWFRVLFQGSREGGNEVGVEVRRLAGGELPDPGTTAGFGGP
ncbi:hypothetical protein LTR91_018732 [Friedmanniomyces endolithicus]|uniref:F-box domain-containing protein n=1 Tax=Friedmanniomyces endolithicus TaxID=329885 RepID=A0AAN6K581_9PEZI|nr:hypothetical protein LTS01_020088 [Friedmanniomyces endolithicus]KAK0963927.1 hypothetical protein LTR91_018732 [Friedmanniomyces endolithicus]KAK1026178.1 hypothetical protein LTS16_022573 [Friedmanniomyces endolithicus]